MRRETTPTPSALGYSFPPEFGPQCATWFSWPRPEGISFPGRYHTITQDLAGIIRETALRQDVHINVMNENWHRLVLSQLAAAGVPIPLLKGATRRVFFHYIRTNECWCRDHGPAFVLNGRSTAIVDWKFNAWGAKYPPWNDDDAVPTRIAERARIRVFDAPLVMEGGSVEFNGAGTILTTSQCLLHKNRNPGVSRARIERALLDYYGQRHTVWLSEGIQGDDTDGHIDDLARFLSQDTVVIAVEEDKKDPNYRETTRALTKLQKARDQDGRPFRIVTVPMPARVEYEGQRCPATFMNFLFVNGAVLVPRFGNDGRWRECRRTLEKALPNHEVVPVDSRQLIWGLGSVHCLSQQVPEAPGLRERLRRAAEKPVKF
ncbi:MAG: agmatine deiminase family protein [Phycisphaerales bacterium]